MKRLLLVALISTLGCTRGSSGGAAPSTSSSATSQIVQPAPAATSPRVVPERREGQSLVLAEGEEALYLADEDHKRVRRIALVDALKAAPPVGDKASSVDLAATEISVETPGRPAQVISLGDRLLVTLRDPGLLLVLQAGSLKELGRVSLPADAWGLAISSDGKSAYVTSAWTRKLSRVDVSTDAPKLVWSVDVAREPRAVAVTPDGTRAYVSHLIGAPLTRVDLGGEPKVTRVELPADPLETFSGEVLHATLGYSAVLSPDGRRLFVARHAMGAMWAWQGRTTVDVLATADDQPLAPTRKGKPFGTLTQMQLEDMKWMSDHSGVRAEGDEGAFVQPRAMILRKKTGHVLVASEGRAQVVELDAMSMAPALVTNRRYRLGGLVENKLPNMTFPPRCGAPTGMVLSADEDVLWVHCRTTDNVVAVRLTPDGTRARREEIQYLEMAEYHTKLSVWGPFAYASLAVPAAPEDLLLGRRLFYDATESVVSGKMACAGCHPEGRDDGHVWREKKMRWGGPQDFGFLAGPTLAEVFSRGENTEKTDYGAPRQTPMIAGRVQGGGPFGWHGESDTLEARIRAGFGLHRAEPMHNDGVTMKMRADPLARFVRDGLVSPPRTERPLTPEEERGKAVFTSAETKCATCHVPEKGFTDHSVTALRGFATRPLFALDTNLAYKVPSLLHVGSTEPYYHDASFATLDDLIEKNLDRMGKTSHLSREDRAALVAYMRTL
jgi:cytochrome c peroxidase